MIDERQHPVAEKRMMLEGLVLQCIIEEIRDNKPIQLLRRLCIQPFRRWNASRNKEESHAVLEFA
jgi:hypothetical protein